MAHIYNSKTIKMLYPCGTMHDAIYSLCSLPTLCAKSSYHFPASHGKMITFHTDLCRREAAEWMINMADSFEHYVLMHTNTPVVNITLDNDSASISAIGVVHHAAHLPVGIAIKKGVVNRTSLNEWWKGRAIPVSRDGIKCALQNLNLLSTQKLLDKCLGLSLSDQYWICPVNSDLTWSSVNFYENSFSDDVGNILFGKGSGNETINLMSPDNTSDGWLRKKWTIVDGKRFLLKGGSGATQQEPYNEVLASILAARLGIAHVPYTLVLQEDYPYSMCEDFIAPHTELISAWYIMQTQPKANHLSVYQHYLNCCGALGIPGVCDSLDRMLVLDYLLVNEDRHQNNFGVIRNAETLIYIGAAPIYDSGTSLWFDKPTSMIGSGKVTCKPFKNSHEEQINLVSSFDWLDLGTLHDIVDELHTLFRGSIFVDEIRATALCNALNRRIKLLAQVVNNRKVTLAVDDRSTDISTNIAYCGTQTDEL